MRTQQLLFSFLGLTLAACGSSGTLTPDAGSSGATYPAFTVPLPQLMSSGGPVLATPHLTSVTFAGETRTADLDQFVATLPTLTSWTGVLAQYGVTGMTAEAPIHSSTALEGTVSDSVQGGTSEIHDLLTAIIGQSTPDPDAIYVVFIPAGVGVEIDGQPFFGGEAYHFHFAVGTTEISYVVVPYPADTVTTLGGQTLAGTDAMTGITSHEIAEAATDPLTRDHPGLRRGPDRRWRRLGDHHRLIARPEIGDICAPTPDAIYKPDGFGYCNPAPLVELGRRRRPQPLPAARHRRGLLRRGPRGERSDHDRRRKLDRPHAPHRHVKDRERAALERRPDERPVDPVVRGQGHPVRIRSADRQER